MEKAVRWQTSDSLLLVQVRIWFIYGRDERYTTQIRHEMTHI